MIMSKNSEIKINLTEDEIRTLYKAHLIVKHINNMGCIVGTLRARDGIEVYWEDLVTTFNTLYELATDDTITITQDFAEETNLLDWEEEV